MNKYKMIKLEDGTWKHEHRAVMEAHLGRRLLSRELVHHKNGNKADNRLENLEVMSLSDHTRHHVTKEQIEKIAFCDKAHGEEHVRAKLNEKQVLEIVARRAKDEGLESIAKDYPVSYIAIANICNGFSWKHVTQKNFKKVEIIVPGARTMNRRNRRKLFYNLIG